MKIYWHNITLFDNIVYEHPAWHTSKEALFEDLQDCVKTICSEIASAAEKDDEFKWDDAFEDGNPNSLTPNEDDDCDNIVENPDQDATYEECLETYKRIESLTKLENFVNTGRVDECGFAPTRYNESIIGEAPYYLEASISTRVLRDDVKREMRAVLKAMMKGSDGWSDERSCQSEDTSAHLPDNTDPLTLIEAMYDRLRKVLAKAEKSEHRWSAMDSETDELEYDFALSDDMNGKLKKAVMLLDEVRFKLAQGGEEFTEDFVNELNQGTKRITDAIRRLDQDPIV